MSRHFGLVAFIVSILVVGLWAQDVSQPSKKELYLRARDAMKEALEQGNTERAGQALDYLKKNVENGAPLTLFEEYLANMKIGRYEDGIKIYANIRQVILDSACKPPDVIRLSSEDALNLYLYRGLSPYTKHVADSLYAVVDSSSISQEYKDLYKTLLYSELVLGLRVFKSYDKSVIFNVINDTTAAEEFLQSAKNFTLKYPVSGHSHYLKEQTVPFVQEYMDEQRQFRTNPWAHKYYTGGLGIYVSKWMGIFGGDVAKYVDYELDGTFMAEIQVQVMRVVLGVFYMSGLNSELKEGYFSNYDVYFTNAGTSYFSVLLGIDVYEQKYVKVTPFVALGGGDMMDEITYDYLFYLGANVDIPLFATRPSRIGGLSAGVHIRLKYMAQFGSMDERSIVFEGKEDSYYGDFDIEDGHKIGNSLNHFFSIGIGFYLW